MTKFDQYYQFIMERCWSGYEPVPNKEPYSKGSCRKKKQKKKK